MSEIKDGGPVFPQPPCPDCGVQHAPEHVPGMSMRDYFAAKAMFPCYSELARQVGEGELSGFGWGEVAQSAYIAADALLKARESK